MTIVPLRDVPRYERHLLFCSKPTRSRRNQVPVRNNDLAAINRSLAVHDDCVASTWPATSNRTL